MGRRSSWSGSISFGLVNVPVKLYTVIKDESVHFNQIHAECGSRINMPKVCRTCDVEVLPSDLIKGMEVGGQMITFTDEELEGARVDATKAVEIVGTISYSDIPFLRLDAEYYVGSDTKTKIGGGAFLLLTEALTSAGKAAVARITMRAGKEQTCIIRPYAGLLLLSTLHWANEVQDPDDIDMLEAAVTDAEVAMARTLIDSIPDGMVFLTDAVDGYKEAVERLLEQKLNGTVAVAAPQKPTPQLPDLMAALKASVEQVQSAKKKAKK